MQSHLLVLTNVFMMKQLKKKIINVIWLILAASFRTNLTDLIFSPFFFVFVKVILLFIKI